MTALNNSLKKVIYFSLGAIAFVVIIITFVLWIYQVNHQITREFKSLEMDYINQKKSLIRERVISVEQQIRTAMKTLDSKNDRDIQRALIIGANICDSLRLADGNPKLSDSELQRLYTVFAAYQYHESLFYFQIIPEGAPFRNWMAQRIILNEDEIPELESDNWYKTIQEQALEHVGIPFDFQVAKDSSNQNSFFKCRLRYLPEAGIFLLAGLDNQRTVNDLQQDLLQYIARLRYGPDDYIFVNTYDGDALISDGKVVKGKINLWNHADPDGVMVIQEERKAVENPQGDFIYYRWVKLTEDIIMQKVSFIKGIPEWQWMIGTGAYFDEIESIIQQRQTALKAAYRQTILSILIALPFLAAIVLIMAYYITRRVNGSYYTFLDFFNQAMIKDKPIDLAQVHFAEFQNLAKSANEMLKERARLRAESEEERHRLQTIFYTVPVGLGITQNGLITHFNDQLSIISGYSREEIEKSTLARYLINPLLLDKAHQQGEVVDLETRLICRKGTLKDILLNYQPIQGGEHLRRYLFTITDITEQNTVIRELEESRRQQSVLLNGITDAVIATDADGNINYLNPAASELFNLKPDQTLGKAFDDCIIFHHPETSHPVTGMIQNMLRYQKPDAASDMRLDCLTSGKRLFLIANFAPLYNKDGSFFGIIVVIKDMTHRYQSEMQIQETNARFKMLSEELASAVFTANESGQFSFVNEKMCELSGYSRNDLEKMSLPDLFQEESKAELKKLLQTLFESREKLEDREYLLLTANKEEKTVILTINKVMVQGLPEVIGVLHDISRQKEAEKEILSSLKEKEILLKEVHHRVKNNMQIISSILRMQSRLSSDPLTLELLRESQNRVLTMAMIHEKLYQSRNLAAIDYGDYVRGLLAELFSSYNPKETKIEFKTDIENDFTLPVNLAIPCGLIINELISNILKHAFHGREKGVITISLRGDAPGNYTLRIADDGIGFPKDFSWEASNSLGIRLVRSLIRQINGTINIHSENGAAIEIQF
jgi:PAS domain S-box-containing protein